MSKGCSETVIQRKYNDLQKRDKKAYNGQHFEGQTILWPKKKELTSKELQNITQKSND